jgi:DNA replication protein DnaC
MNAAVDGLEPLFRGLGLHAMRVEYRGCLINAEKENWGYLRLIQRLLEIELAARAQRKIERLLADSRLPAEFTLATLNPQKLNEKPRRMLPSLLTGDFVQRGDNILCFGLPGRGKSLYCAAIAPELVRQQQIRALFVPSFKLVSDLLLAKATHALPKALEQLARYALIVVDDIGYVQHSAEEMEVLFTFLAERYQQQKSLMV